MIVDRVRRSQGRRIDSPIWQNELVGGLGIEGGNDEANW
jgi:hypothetical protein